MPYIIKIYVCRQSIPDESILLANTITKGVYEKNRKRLGYKTVFHTYVYLVLDNGKKIIVEKRGHGINVITDPTSIHKQKSLSECMTITTPIPCHLTLRTLLRHTRDYMGSKFNPYDPIYNNCQMFVNAILKSNHLFDPKLKPFYTQDVKELFSRISKRQKQLVRIVPRLQICEVFHLLV